MNKIALAYCEENKERAESTRKNLESTGLTFEMVQLSKSRPDIQLTEVLQSFSGPIILFVSDNFLKSTQCMAGGLRFLQEKRDQLLPVVLEGYQENENGEIETINTQFDRVSDIIQYINFWQDRYLSMRRQKRQLENVDEETFNIHLKNMRDISTEVGEYLRILRSIDHYPIHIFEASDYRMFFHFLDEEQMWESFKNSRPQTDAAPEPVAEPTPEEEEAEGTPPVELTDIPGISQLEEAAAKDDNEPPQEEVEIADEPMAEPEAELHEIAMQGTASPENTPEEAPIPDEEVISERDTLDFTPPAEEAPVVERGPSVLEMDHAEESIEEVNVETEVLEESPEIEEVEAPSFLPLSSEEIGKLIDESWERAEAGDVDGGLDILANAIESPEHPAVLHYHAAVLNIQYKNDLDAASSHLKILLEEDETNVGGHFLCAELEEMSENLTLARYHYERVDQLEPDYSETNLRLGSILAHHYPKESQQAEKYLKKALDQSPKNAEVLYEMGLLYSDVLNQPEKAIRYLKKTLKQEPEHPFANYDLALLYHKEGKLKKAFKYYQLATVINPELKTSENDMAFTFDPKKDAEFSAIEHDTISALKKNIDQLESLLKAREQEVQKMAAKRHGDGKTVLISGGTSGIGRATAEVFAQNGFRVLITGRRDDRLAEIKDYLIKEHETEVETLNFDIRDQAAVQAQIDGLTEEWRNIDILINNAGKAKGLVPIHEGELHHWEEMVDTNIKGLLYLTRVVSPAMVARKSGHIINVCSTAGKEVYPGGNVYSATKYAVDALTKSMRLDLYKHNIRVSQVSPAHVEETEFALVRFDGDAERAKIYEDFKPLTAADVADAIYYMATRPAHVNVQDILMMGTQQANSNFIDRSGREEEE